MNIDIWPLMRKLANCNGEGCYVKLPNCPDYANCKVDSERILEFIEALITQREQGMREALQEWKQVVADSYSLYMPTNRVQDMLDDVLSLIDTALKGEGK